MQKGISFALHVVKDPMVESTAGENLVPDKRESIAESLLGHSISSKTNRQR
jgi:hypothetical protein